MWTDRLSEGVANVGGITSTHRRPRWAHSWSEVIMSGTTLDDYTDRYAARVGGMVASEIRALFAVASRPEVVSLAGGAPFIAALPLDAWGR